MRWTVCTRVLGPRSGFKCDHCIVVAEYSIISCPREPQKGVHSDRLERMVGKCRESATILSSPIVLHFLFYRVAIKNSKKYKI